MQPALQTSVHAAKQAALEVLSHNVHGPYRRLPRTAGWGYPEPYTRDWMISALGVLVSGDKILMACLRRMLEALARNQSPLGNIPSLAHDPADLGASDTTPLFLIGLALFRRVTGEADFLDAAAQRALVWLRYQSPDNSGLIGQQPTSDWRDEQWVLGYGLYVNALVYLGLRLFNRADEAGALKKLINQSTVPRQRRQRRTHEGLALPGQPYYALWSYKVLHDDRFDLLGNSLAILAGIASPARAKKITAWLELECDRLRARGELAPASTPCLLPFIQPGDLDWRPRYQRYNRPGDYHNGGVWPFICGFHVAACVAAGRPALAEQKLAALTELVRPARRSRLSFGFNEWLNARDGAPRGQDWQTWSAAMYLYAAAAVEQKRTPFFDEVRGLNW